VLLAFSIRTSPPPPFLPLSWHGESSPALVSSSPTLTITAELGSIVLLLKQLKKKQPSNFVADSIMLSENLLLQEKLRDPPKYQDVVAKLRGILGMR